MSKQKKTPPRKTWLDVGASLRPEPPAGVYSAAFSLTELEGRGALKRGALDAFRRVTGLSDFTWRALWTRGAVVQAGGRSEFLRTARAVIVFIHGWDGSGAIWENLPAQLCAAEHDCLILAPDVNGFGRSPFAQPDQLKLDQCNPAANMRAVERWMSLLTLLGGRRRYPTVFVGHSMGGAALFYLNERAWSGQSVARYAIAPALLTNDLLRQSFYRTLGAGIWAGSTLALDKLQNQVAPFIINQLIAGASKAVQAEHRRIFRATDKFTTARTFYAMGLAKRPAHGPRWPLFQVALGHADRLVGLAPMLSLLADLGFTSDQVRVVLGDHYFFSVGRHSKHLHEENRKIVLKEIRELVEACVKSN